MKEEAVKQIGIRQKEYDIYIRNEMKQLNFVNSIVSNMFWKNGYCYIHIMSSNKDKNKDKTFEHCTIRFGGNVKMKIAHGAITNDKWRIQRFHISYKHNLNAKHRFTICFEGKNNGFRIKCFAIKIVDYKSKYMLTNTTIQKMIRNNRFKLLASFYEAVFNCDWEKFESLLNQGLWDFQFLKGRSIEDTQDLPYQPIHHITIALDILLNWDDWNEKVSPIIRQKAIENEKFKKFFTEKCKVSMEYKELLTYDNYSYCTPEDPFSEVFDFSREELNQQGFRNLDINLYWAVYTLNFEWAEKLLQEGANPNIEVDSGHNVYWILDWMQAGPCMEVDPYLTRNNNKYKIDVDSYHGDFAYMIRYALFAKMQQLVEKYDSDN